MLLRQELWFLILFRLQLTPSLGRPSGIEDTLDLCSTPAWVVPRLGMTEEVVVTRKGQTTIPIRLREKYGIREGTRLEVLDSGSGILMKPVPSTVDLAGSGAKYASPREMKRLLDKLREEDA